MSGPIPDLGAAIPVLHQNSMGGHDTAPVNPNLFWIVENATLMLHVNKPLAYLDCFI